MATILIKGYEKIDNKLNEYLDKQEELNSDMVLKKIKDYIDEQL